MNLRACQTHDAVPCGNEQWIRATKQCVMGEQIPLAAMGKNSSPRKQPPPRHLSSPADYANYRTQGSRLNSRISQINAAPHRYMEPTRLGAKIRNTTFWNNLHRAIDARHAVATRVMNGSRRNTFIVRTALHQTAYLMVVGWIGF